MFDGDLMRQHVAHITNAIENFDDESTTEEQRDKLAASMAISSVVVVGSVLISIAESLERIAQKVTV